MFYIIPLIHPGGQCLQRLAAAFDHKSGFVKKYEQLISRCPAHGAEKKAYLQASSLSSAVSAYRLPGLAIKPISHLSPSW